MSLVSTVLAPPAPTIFDRVPLLRGVRAAARDEWGQAARLVSYNKGHVLLTQGDVADWWYVIQSGWIKLFRETIEGDEVVLDLLTQNHVFGETAYFLGQQYAAGAEVAEDCTLWVLPQALLVAEIKNNPPFALALMSHMAQTQARRDKDLEHHAIQSAAQRLGCFLLRLCGDEARGNVTLRLPLDKHLIATYLGMKPETFSRTLGRLADDVGLVVDGTVVQIPRLHDLVRYTCQACSNVFPCES